MSYQLPATLAPEIDDLERQINRFIRGEISDAELKARRVPFGIYEQRTKGHYMTRIRCAAGMISPSQLSVVATLAQESGSGRLHITTRQEIQIHDLPLESLISVLRSLYESGLSTRGGGGNTVRNITASWDSGITNDELFDVTPHAVELTSRLIELPGSWLLPRKFKIAFSNTEADTAFATINDLGFIAQIRNGRKGFRVFVAGGMGRAPEPGQLLHEFVDESEVFHIAEAIKRVFSRYGNRKNKHTARLRFLWNTLDRSKFLQVYEDELNTVFNEHPARLRLPDISESHTVTLHKQDSVIFSREFEQWKIRYTGSQRQTGYSWVRYPLTEGELKASEALEIATAVSVFGNDVLRFSQDQNLVFRNIPEQSLPALFALSRKHSPLSSQAPVLSSAVACAGASTCQLGICLSRGALRASIEELSHSNLDLDALNGIRIHFSGCFNSCGQHGIADIGFSGKVARKDDHAYPVYSVAAGAIIDSKNGSTLAQTIADIPARSVPAFLLKFFSRYIERKNAFISYHDYLVSEGFDSIRSICSELSFVPSFDDDPLWYRDWGADRSFSLEGRGNGECAAGLFDLIEIDITKARKARELLPLSISNQDTNVILREILFYSARALLVIQTGEIVQDANVPEEFINRFVKTGMVPNDATTLMKFLGSGDTNGFVAHKSAILSFADTIVSLYTSLDESFQFEKPGPSLHASIHVPDSEVDFRGVACPMNFVKTKLALSRIKPGQVLRIILDSGAPVENVPVSAEAEGHSILGKTNLGEYWAVLIRRGGSDA
jgi:sulfite reductase (ferredoxin)